MPSKLQEPSTSSSDSRLAVEGERQHHVLADGQGRDEIEVLEDVAEDLPPDPGESPLSESLSAAEDAPAGKMQFP